jgi:hypothetical protein
VPAVAGASSAFVHRPGTLLAVHESGGVLRDAAIRVALSCEDGNPYTWASRLRIVRRVPTRFDNRGYLIPLGRSAGLIRARIFARWGPRRRHDTFRGTIELTPGVTATRLRLRLRSHSADPAARCSVDVERVHHADDGLLYAGHTNDDEPVVLIRRPGLVEWLSGYGMPCTSRGFIEDIHADALLMTGPGTFGWPGLVPGFSDGDADRSVHVAGAFAGERASGTLRMVARRGAQFCRQRMLRWEARA